MLLARAQRDLVLVSISREGDSRARITRITRDREPSFKADRLSRARARQPSAAAASAQRSRISDVAMFGMAGRDFKQQQLFAKRRHSFSRRRENYARGCVDRLTSIDVGQLHVTSSDSRVAPCLSS